MSFWLYVVPFLNFNTHPQTQDEAMLVPFHPKTAWLPLPGAQEPFLAKKSAT